MRLTVPPLEIGESEGFSDEKDIFQRKAFGERLSKLIENSNGELVIALDAPWGEGKSTFIKMWRGYLRNENNGVQTIYFDAFENDYQTTPFLALAGEIYNLIEESNEEEKSRFKDVTTSALKTVGRVGLRIGIKALTAGVLDETAFDVDTKKDISKEASGAIDNYVTSRLNAVSKDKRSIKEFKQYLEALPAKLPGNGKTITFIIDELDRCKPPFALEIVEVVKHLFSVPNMTFILVMNRSQIEASVRNEYGTVDPSGYLQKFINLWISLPKNKGLYIDESDAKKYLHDCVKRMEMEAPNLHDRGWMKRFEVLVVHYNLSLREIERALTNFAFIRMGSPSNLNDHYMWLTAYLSIIKVRYTEVYHLLATSQIEYADLVKKTNLNTLEERNWASSPASVESHYLKWLLRYYLSDEEQAGALLSEGNHLGGIIFSNGRTAIKDICKWLDSFRFT